MMNDEVKKKEQDKYMKVRAKIKFEAVGVEGTTLQELKILFFNGLISREKFEEARAMRKKLDQQKMADLNTKFAAA